MFYKLARYIIAAGFICLISNIVAQETDPQNSAGSPSIDSAMATSPAFMPVYVAPFNPIHYMPLHYTPIDTSTLHTPEYDPLRQTQNIYQSLGIDCQAHQSMLFDYEHEMGFSMITLPYSLYFKQQKDLQLYDVQTSYTKLAYTYGIPTENGFTATHAQKIKQVSMAFHLHGNGNDGYFIHQGVNALNLDGLIHYQTKKDIYGFNLSYILNHLKVAENGGITDYNSFADRAARNANVTNDLGSFNVLFSNASTLINTHDACLQQYVNFRNKKGHYFGTISHTFQFKKLNSMFFDQNLNNDFYQNRYYISTDTTKDTLHYYSIINTLQWSNYEPSVLETTKNYDFKIAGGIQHEYVHAKMPFYTGNSVSLFARTAIRLFKVWDLYGGISYSFLDYTKNDAAAHVQASFAINRKQLHFIGFGADYYRVSPDFFYAYYIGNNNVWYNEWPKQNNLKLNAFWTIFDYKVSFNYFMMDNYLFLDDTYTPTLCEKAINLIQLNVYAPLRLRNFYLDANLALQHATKSYISVPLFAGKLSAAYCFRIFKNKLKLQIGSELWYNTLYFADGYNPLVHQFYHQDRLKVGNYLYFNLNLTIQVERIALFARAGNLLAGAFSYKYFTTPDYPMQGRNFEIGVTWRFYD